MFDATELQNFGLEIIDPPKDLWRNRFNENGVPIFDLTIRYLNISSALVKYLGEMQYHVLLGGSSTNSSFLADEAQPQDFDWIVLLNEKERSRLNLVEESDMLTATPEINPWMTPETRDQLKFHDRHTVAPQIAANKTQFNDVIVKEIPEAKKLYFSFENNQWYYANSLEV